MPLEIECGARAKEMTQVGNTVHATDFAAVKGLSRVEGDERTICISRVKMHMTPCTAAMYELKPYSRKDVKNLFGKLLSSAGNGNMTVVFGWDEKVPKTTLTNVAYVPRFCFNLFSLMTVSQKACDFSWIA